MTKKTLNTNQWDEYPPFTIMPFRAKRIHEITNADLMKDANKITEIFVERFPSHTLNDTAKYIAAYFKKKEKAAYDKGYRKAFNEVEKDNDNK
jgi:hypothetical protein